MKTKHPFSNKHLDQDLRLCPCDNDHKQKLAKRKERLSITENQSREIFKLRDEPNTGIGISTQETKAKLVGKRQIDSLQQNLQESLQAGYGT